MSIKCSVFIATSVDGFISRDDGSIDWLMKVNSLVPEGEDGGYKSFISTVDGLDPGAAEVFLGDEIGRSER